MVTVWLLGAFTCNRPLPDRRSTAHGPGVGSIAKALRMRSYLKVLLPVVPGFVSACSFSDDFVEKENNSINPFGVFMVSHLCQPVPQPKGRESVGQLEAKPDLLQ